MQKYRIERELARNGRAIPVGETTELEWLNDSERLTLINLGFVTLVEGRGKGNDDLPDNPTTISEMERVAAANAANVAAGTATATGVTHVTPVVTPPAEGTLTGEPAATTASGDPASAPTKEGTPDSKPAGDAKPAAAPDGKPGEWDRDDPKKRQTKGK